MKILFVIPISDERFNSTPDIGQGYLAALARQSGHSIAFLRFYGRPRVALNVLRRVRTPAQLKTIFNGILRSIAVKR